MIFRYFKTKFFMKNILLGTFIIFSVTLCKPKKESEKTENTVSKPQIQLVKAPSSPAYLDSELNLSDINLTATDTSYLVDFDFDLSLDVLIELRGFVSNIAVMYRENPFHNL